jgi:hypothetical protein
MKKPTSWDDISVDQFMELKSLDFETDRDELHMISIILDLPFSQLEDMLITDLQKYTADINFLSKPLSNTPHKSIQIKGQELFKIDLNHISIGEFIDLEELFKIDYIQELPKILSILYRPLIHSDEPDLYPSKPEPYGDYINHRSKLFLEVPINYVYGVIHEYINFRNTIFKSYEGLFDDPIEEGEDVELTQSEKNINKWGWSLILYKICDGDPTKFDEATNVGLLLTLNMLSIQKEFNIQKPM